MGCFLGSYPLWLLKKTYIFCSLVLQETNKYIASKILHREPSINPCIILWATGLLLKANSQSIAVRKALAFCCPFAAKVKHYELAATMITLLHQVLHTVV